VARADREGHRPPRGAERILAAGLQSPSILDHEHVGTLYPLYREQLSALPDLQSRIGRTAVVAPSGQRGQDAAVGNDGADGDLAALFELVAAGVLGRMLRASSQAAPGTTDERTASAAIAGS
jgi:hypothetical protein